MKPLLFFSNGYWSWVHEETRKTGYTCIVCAGRDAAALAKKRASEKFERELMVLRAKWSVHDWSDYSDHLPDAVPSDPDEVFVMPLIDPAPGSIINGNEGDPGFPPRRNWFRRLLDRIF